MSFTLAGHEIVRADVRLTLAEITQLWMPIRADRKFKPMLAGKGASGPVFL